MKKKLIVVFFGLLTLLSPLVVYAAQQGYVSSLYVGSQSLHTGAERSYTYANHKFDFSVGSVYEYLPKRLVVTLNKKNLIGSTQHSRVDVGYVAYSTTTAWMGNHGSGKKFYRFGTHSHAYTNNGGTGTIYSNISADWVQMVSYN